MVYKINNDSVLVELKGELDISNADSFKKNCLKIADEEKLGFTFDCINLDFIDSTALGVFVSLNNKVLPYNKKITLKNLKPNLKKLFVITNLDKTIQIEET